MKLLFPEFDLTDVKTSQTANEYADDEQPCCSKDLNGDESRGQNKESRKETKGNADKGEEREEQKKDENKQEAKKGEMENGRRDGMGEKDEGQVEGRCQAREDDESPEDVIRNSGLISHSYSLDLNLNPGEYKSLI